MSRLGDTYPVVSFAVVPLSLSFSLLFDIEPNTMAMHHIILPLTNVSVSICKELGTFTINLPAFEVSFESWLIRPGHNSLTFHVVVLEFSFVELTCICKIILSGAMELAIDEIALVEATIELKATLAWFFAFNEVSSVFYFIIIPALGTKPMLLIIKPISFIHTSVSVYEHPKTICFSIFPLSLVYISINMSHSSSSVVEAVHCLAFKDTSIYKLYNTKAFPDVHIIWTPLSLVLFDWSCFVTTFRICIFDIFEIVQPYKTFSSHFRAHEPLKFFVRH